MTDLREQLAKAAKRFETHGAFSPLAGWASDNGPQLLDELDRLTTQNTALMAERDEARQAYDDVVAANGLCPSCGTRDSTFCSNGYHALIRALKSDSKEADDAG